MPKKRQYMQKFRVASNKKKRKHIAAALRWLLMIIKDKGDDSGK